MIRLLDLQAQYLSLKEEIDAAVLKVLGSSQYVLGSEVASFEEEFAAYCRAKYAIGVNSGTSALHLALLAAGIGPGDEVITVPFTFVATTAAVYYTGARPVFVDIDPLTCTMDPAQVEAAITERTKAILPVHLYGQPADIDPIMEVARRHNLVVIEDAAQAHGAAYKERHAGNLGDLACFSFYPSKNLGAYGEGGMVVTSNPEYAKRVQMLRDWGQEHKYHHVLKGFNARMEGIQGAVLRVKLRHLEAWNEARRAIARAYSEALRGTGVGIPVEAEYAKHVYYVYAIRVKQRDQVQKLLAAEGVQTGIHYPFPIHLLPAYADLGYRVGQFPHSEQAAAEVLSLPLFPELTREQIHQVVTAVQKVMEVVGPGG